MKAQHLLLFSPISTACAFAGLDYTNYNQQHRPQQLPSPTSASSKTELSSLSRMRGRDNDVVLSSSLPSVDPIELTTTMKGDTELFHSIFSHNNKILGDEKEDELSKKRLKHATVREAEAEHGMPWKASIDPEAFNDDDEELLYMQFWEWQLDFMEKTLTDFRVESCENEDGSVDFSFNTNDKKKARIVNICASSKEYRKIRMTYYDAGDTTQVYNAVLYPRLEYNLPILGIDLLAFNRKKYLAIVDFQPIHDTEADHATQYEHLLQPIKEQYDSLKGRMSSKFYDETKHFSQQMLFARFDDESVVERDLFPAFRSYVQTHLDLIRDTEPETNTKAMKDVLRYHTKYDTYSADRDPATGLFAAMYGKEWAEDFVHNFLFDLSDPPSDDDKKKSASPSGGGGGGNPFANGGNGGDPQQQRSTSSSDSGGGSGGGNPFARWCSRVY